MGTSLKFGILDIRHLVPAAEPDKLDLHPDYHRAAGREPVALLRERQREPGGAAAPAAAELP